ncbi:MAG: selenocysteine-specific elongation factor, partial [Planctomycetota bacterium]
DVRELLAALEGKGEAVHTGPQDRWMHADALVQATSDARAGLTDWFAENPHRSRMDVRDLRTRTKTEAPFLAMLLERLEKDGDVVLEAGGHIGLAGREAAFGEKETKLREGALAKLQEAGYQPPTADELREGLGSSEADMDLVIESMLDRGEVVRIGAGLLIAREAHDEARTAVVENCQANGQLEIPGLRDRLGTTRKYLIPILESFDTEGLTMRQGGTRVLRRK